MLEGMRQSCFARKDGEAAFGLNRGGDPELEADSELRACQELIGKRVRLSEEALADEGVNLRSLLRAAP